MVGIAVPLGSKHIFGMFGRIRFDVRNNPRRRCHYRRGCLGTGQVEFVGRTEDVGCRNWFQPTPMNENTLLTVEGLLSQVLRDISFTVKQGEALAVIGPNGAGKTPYESCPARRRARIT